MRVVTDEEGRAGVRSALDEIADGAQRMLAAALEAEVDAYIAGLVEYLDEKGRRLVVRNGHFEPHTITTGAGHIEVQAPSGQDRRSTTTSANAAAPQLDAAAVDVRDYVYIWADGAHFNLRLEEDCLCASVIVDVRTDGTKELVAITDGYRSGPSLLGVHVVASCDHRQLYRRAPLESRMMGRPSVYNDLVRLAEHV